MKLFEVIFGTSWRTTITGYLGAAALGIVPVLQTGTFETKDLILPAVIAVCMRFAKDTGATGAGK